jgi:hypothetical protein
MEVRKMKSRKAVSPVISAVILVGVGIAVNVAVAFWMGGMAGQYAKFEKVELQSGLCVKSGATGGEYWNITLKLKNTGTAASTIIGCFINEVEVDCYNTTSAVDGDAVTTMTDSDIIESGVSKYVSILIDFDNYNGLTSGTTVNIKIVSAGGMEYLKLLELV